MTVQPAQNVVNGIVHQQAALDVDETAPFPVNVAQSSAFPAYREPGVVAIAELPGRGQGGGDGHIAQAPDALQGILDGLAFHLKLVRICNVLPLAARALSKVPARRRLPVRRRSDHLHHLSRYVVAALSNYLYVHFLAWYATEHKDGFISQVGQRLTESSHSYQFKAH